MPAQHNHSDRGALHDACDACELVARMMEDAGVSPAQVYDYRRDDDTNSARLNVDGREMGNKASVDADRLAARIAAGTTVDPAGIDADLTGWLTRNFAHPGKGLFQINDSITNPSTIVQGGSVTINTGQAHRPRTQRHQAYNALRRHLSSGEHMIIPATGSLTYDQAVALHAHCHDVGIGHKDNREHFVRPVTETDIEAQVEQERAINRRRQSRRLEQSNRAHREARERALKRISEIQASMQAAERSQPHLKRGQMSQVAGLTIKAGINPPESLAVVTLHDQTGLLQPTVGIGTALCKPGDRFDEGFGTSLAVARALRSFGRQYEKALLDFDHQRSR